MSGLMRNHRTNDNDGNPSDFKVMRIVYAGCAGNPPWKAVR